VVRPRRQSLRRDRQCLCRGRYRRRHVDGRGAGGGRAGAGYASREKGRCAGAARRSRCPHRAGAGRGGTGQGPPDVWPDGGDQHGAGGAGRRARGGHHPRPGAACRSRGGVHQGPDRSRPPAPPRTQWGGVRRGTDERDQRLRGGAGQSRTRPRWRGAGRLHPWRGQRATRRQQRADRGHQRRHRARSPGRRGPRGAGPARSGAHGGPRARRWPDHAGFALADRADGVPRRADAQPGAGRRRTRGGQFQGNRPRSHAAGAAGGNPAGC
ncbi:hypothetical protein OY671_008556, partial [Metschnikowia pulcherrima]